MVAFCKSWNQSQAQAGIGREHAVEANQMQERTRHQGGQACSPAMDATTAMRPELPEYASAKFVRGPVDFGVMVILATEYNIIGHDHSHGVIGHWSYVQLASVRLFVDKGPRNGVADSLDVL